MKKIYILGFCIVISCVVSRAELPGDAARLEQFNAVFNSAINIDRKDKKIHSVSEDDFDNRVDL